MENSSNTAQAQIAALVGSFLSAVTFERDDRPSYQSIRDIVILGALFIKNTSDVPEISGVDEFITPRQLLVDNGTLIEFSETELSATTDVFGRIGQRLSIYRKAGVSDGVAFTADGVIATQVVLTPGGWRISSMAWDDERAGLTLTQIDRTPSRGGLGALLPDLDSNQEPPH
jgi:hypothetical protein